MRACVRACVLECVRAYACGSTMSINSEYQRVERTDTTHIITNMALVRVRYRRNLSKINALDRRVLH